ncbi:MAG: dethiobiotin synthase [Armatimonadota bacterium]|nr:dethiobiotin synthase [Armatimonadota bacterium]
MSGVFITGTDTGVGKTVVAAGLLHSLREAGLDAVPMKPVQTGAVRQDGRLISPDLRFCLETSGMTVSPDAEDIMAPYRFETPCSPHLAAQMENNPIELSTICDCFRDMTRSGSKVIAEGAGGVLAPINESASMLDLIQALSVPVILVARSGLGTINHTLLSLDALRAAKVEVWGIIFNQAEHDEPEFIARDNIATVGRLGRAQVLGSMAPLRKDQEKGAALRQVFRRSAPGWQLVLERLQSR